MLSFLFIVALLQCVVGGLIFFILKAVLNKNLTELAVKEFDILKSEPTEKIDEVIVSMYRELKPQVRVRIQKAAYKKWGENVNIVFKQDKKLLGGIDIQFGDYVISSNLKSRLQATGLPFFK